MSELRPHSWLILTCLEALLINYVDSVEFYALQLVACTVSVPHCLGLFQVFAQNQVVINLTQ